MSSTITDLQYRKCSFEKEFLWNTNPSTNKNFFRLFQSSFFVTFEKANRAISFGIQTKFILDIQSIAKYLEQTFDGNHFPIDHSSTHIDALDFIRLRELFLESMNKYSPCFVQIRTLEKNETEWREQSETKRRKYKIRIRC